jgi:hypothetical protein
MRQLPLNTLEDMIAAGPRALRERFGLHPLSKFAANEVKDNAYADAVLEFLNDAVAEPGTMRHTGAMWFLFESEHAFFVACKEAGINADRFREHLWKCRGEIED